MTEISQVPVSEIKAGENDRQHFDQVALEELAQSISEHGLAQPITVRPIWTCSSCGRRDSDFPQWCDACDNNSFHHHYEIVAGERRFRAVRDILKRDTIPAIVRTDLDDEAASAIMLVENTSRADLNPIEEAIAYRARIQHFEWSAEHIAKVAGVSTALVKRRLNLLDLTSEIRHLVAFGNVPIGHAEAMTKLDSNRQRIALRIFRESKSGLPLSHFRAIVNQLFEEQSQDSLFDLENFWVEQVQAGADLPRRGKKAVTGAPTRNDLPKIIASGNTGAIIDRYITSLINTGFRAEAAAVGNLYEALVHTNYASVPQDAKLLTIQRKL